MPRYFFNRIDGDNERDAEGVELADVQSARNQAVIYAGESLKDTPELVFGHEMSIEVTDKDFQVVFSISIRSSWPPQSMGELKP